MKIQIKKKGKCKQRGKLKKVKDDEEKIQYLKTQIEKGNEIMIEREMKR